MAALIGIPAHGLLLPWSSSAGGTSSTTPPGGPGAGPAPTPTTARPGAGMWPPIPWAPPWTGVPTAPPAAARTDARYLTYVVPLPRPSPARGGGRRLPNLGEDVIDDFA